MRLFSYCVALAALAAGVSSIRAQAPAQKPAPKVPAKPSAVSPAEAVPSPVSKHYPILIIAHGTEPVWGLRLGMKGPERLDRLGYPQMALEPAEVVRDEGGNSWTYKAKDSATGAAVTVRLTREPCSDGSAARFTFSILVEHAQTGSLKGCGQSAPDKFPEFRKKNQLDPTENADDKDKDKDKKSVLDPITNAVPPAATAYLDAAGRVNVSRGTVKKIAAPFGSELSLSRDARSLLYTRSDSRTGPDRTIVQYDLDSARSHDLIHGAVRQAFWSPDGSRVAFLKSDGTNWQVWGFPAGAPEKAALVSSLNVTALHGWISSTVVLATDAQNAYWIGPDGAAQQTVPLREIYGGDFQSMSSDTLRVNPVNPDILLVSAFYTHAPAGVPLDATGLNSAFFLYEVRGRRRVVLCPADSWARSAEWSRDGLQIFFTRGVPGKAPLITNRIFWDGSGLRRYETGSDLVIGK